MAPALPRTRFNSAELVRLLAELTPAQVPESTQTLAERRTQDKALSAKVKRHVKDKYGRR